MDRLSFYLYVDLGSGFQLDLLAVFIGQAIRDANLAVQMIRTLDGNLRFFGLSAAGMRLNYFLDFPGKCGNSFCFRHGNGPLR